MVTTSSPALASCLTSTSIIATPLFCQGARQKIGEINRNGAGGDYFPTSLEFIDQNTLLLLDDSSEASSTVLTTRPTITNTASSAAFRPLPARQHRTASTVVTTTAQPNRGNRKGLGRVNLDFAEDPLNPGTFIPTGHSEAESTAFYSDPLNRASGASGLPKATAVVTMSPFMKSTQWQWRRLSASRNDRQSDRIRPGQ